MPKKNFFLVNANTTHIKLACIALFTIITSLLPIILTIFFKNIEKGNNLNIQFVIIVTGVLSLNAICLYLQKIWSVNLTYEFSYNLKKKLFCKVVNSKLMMLKEISDSKIANTYEYDLNVIANFYGDECINSLPIIFSSIIAIIVSIAIMPAVSIISFSVIPIVLFAMQRIVKKLQKSITNMLNQMESVHQIIFETMDNISEIYSFNLENQKRLEFEDYLEKIKKNRVRISLLENTCVLIGSLGNSIPVFAVLVLGMYLVRKGVYSLSSWIVIYYLMEYSNSIFTYLPEFVSSYNEYKVSKKRYEELIKILGFKNQNSRALFFQKKSDVEDTGFSIVLSDINFEYQGKKILNNINLTIKQGEKYLIQGPSGIGKSTLIDIISGVVDPSEGSMIINESSIAYAYSSDRCGLFPGTIQDNLFGSISSSSINKNSIIEKVLQTLNLDNTLKKLPKGLSYQITGGKSTLSGGEQQKFTLARALCRALSEKDCILLLDEATSFIDRASEMQIFENILSESELTIVVVSHRELPEKWFDQKIILTKSGIQTVD